MIGSGAYSNSGGTVAIYNNLMTKQNNKCGAIEFPTAVRRSFYFLGWL